MKEPICHGSRHTVKEGETLYSISRNYQIPLGLLLRSNPYIDIYNLQVGDEICIPCWNQTNCPEGFFHPISVFPVVKPQSEKKEDCVLEHTVRPYDCLQSVLERYNMALYELIELNGLDSIFLLPESTLCVKKG